MDDVIPHRPPVQEHVSCLEQVFKRAKKAQLKIQPDKCKVVYLGHVITSEGLKPHSSKVEYFKNFSKPKCGKKILPWPL